MKVLGLIIVLALSVAGGLLYVNSTTFKSQDVPKSYKVLDDLESKGIYQGEDIIVKDLEGKEINLSSYKSKKAVILSFWATWCEPCVEEFPSFIKLLDQFPEDVVLIAISHDQSEEDVRQFVEAFKGYRDNMVLTMDKGNQLSQTFAVDKLPEGFIFDRQGKLQKKIIGIQDWATPNAIEFFKTLSK